MAAPGRQDAEVENLGAGALKNVAELRDGFLVVLSLISGGFFVVASGLCLNDPSVLANFSKSDQIKVLQVHLWRGHGSFWLRMETNDVMLPMSVKDAVRAEENDLNGMNGKVKQAGLKIRSKTGTLRSSTLEVRFHQNLRPIGKILALALVQLVEPLTSPMASRHV